MVALVPGDGVDGEVAAPQVVLQRDVGRGVDGEALIAAAALALGAGERVFLVRLGMQEHREVLADRLEALLDHLLRGGADHHPVAILDLQAEQLVADGAADDVLLHGFLA
jgi:hypothetical protein